MPGPKLAMDIHADVADLLQVPINFSTSGDNTIIAGVQDDVIRIWKIFFTVSGATQITYDNVSGPLSFTANGAMVLDFDTKPWVTTDIGGSFQLRSSNPVQVSGIVYYTPPGVTAAAVLATYITETGDPYVTEDGLSFYIPE